MYHRPESQLQLFEDFFLPFGGKLNKENRWVQLAAMIPWWRAEEKYAKAFRKSMRGQKPVSVRVALGALYIQERIISTSLACQAIRTTHPSIIRS